MKASGCGFLSLAFDFPEAPAAHRGQATLTGIHHEVPADFGLPVVPGRLEAVGEADAEVLEVPFADQGLRGAGRDEGALDGQHQGGAGVQVPGVIGLSGVSEQQRDKRRQLFTFGGSRGVRNSRHPQRGKPRKLH